jgi:preprotein translocase subunit SecD
MSKWKKVLLNWRVLLLIFCLASSFLLIQPNFWAEGVAIRSVESDGPAELAGMHSPHARDRPMFREVITTINDISIESLEDYSMIVSELDDGSIVRIETLARYTYDGITGIRSMHFFRQKINYVVTYNQTLGLDVYDAPTTNLQKGLDLQGGTRVLLQPEEPISADDVDIVIENLQRRLNVYGLTDLVITQATDLEGLQYILVEIAGVTEDEITGVIGSQGKFEAKIANQTVFTGGDDVTYVCRSADCSFVVDPRNPCGGSTDAGYSCQFSFSISLSQEAANRQAGVTAAIPLDPDGYYLSEDLNLYLDDELVDTLKFGADLKGRPVTDISISGPGYGRSYEEAVQNSATNMKQLQTVLITGSLPVKLEVVKVDSISPTLGASFVDNILWVIFYVIIAVFIVMFIRYRNPSIMVLIAGTMLSEITLILGMASFIGWNLDLAAIAGILVAVGTGIDDQIVILDEVQRKDKNVGRKDWKNKLKQAFFIIMAAYFTTVVAMVPLLWAGAGLVKGFAITTILGVTIGVFVTRPAFAAAAEVVVGE